MRISDWSLDVCSSDLAVTAADMAIPRLTDRLVYCNLANLLSPSAGHESQRPRRPEGHRQSETAGHPRLAEGPAPAFPRTARRRSGEGGRMRRVPARKSGGKGKRVSVRVGLGGR